MSSQKAKLEHYLSCLQTKHAALEARLSKRQSCRGCDDEAKAIKRKKYQIKTRIAEIERALLSMKSGAVLPWPASKEGNVKRSSESDTSLDWARVV